MTDNQKENADFEKKSTSKRTQPSQPTSYSKILVINERCKK
jgi:hypothetical protein